ncbi:dockerin type I repeat-containing protein [Paucibacter sp. KCTC 42545]|uniref:dockerin type I repeat-containing protein n=1 Tax=Paucibacter sp. KCTC 42545 TaxID=1768242 RepID=UPI0012E387A9|nr:dockerin type I repeat-containing protein [Paucibacter sp. KCTC 42545]
MSLIRRHPFPSLRSLRLSTLCLAQALALGLSLLAPAAQAQNTGLVNAMATNTQAGPITAGATQLRMPIAVSAFNSLKLQLILPVSGAQISLIDPQGTVVIAANDPRISFLDGASLTPPLPGGLFITPEIANPVDGNWTLLATFPPAPVPTVALLNLYAQSPYQVGMVLSGQSYRVGQPVPLGVLALNQGLPILGLAPSLTLKKDGNPIANVSAVDSGQAADFDGLASDGIYSRGYTFNQTGRYQVDAQVDIPTAGGGNVRRTATGFVDIVPANFTFGAVSSSVTRGANNCISKLNVTLTGTVALPGTYSTAATLLGPNGSASGSLLKRANTTLAAAGALSSTVSFSSTEIRQHFSEGGSFVVDPLDLLAFAGASPQLEMRRNNALSFSGMPLEQFCAAAIEVANGATVSPVLRGSHIGQLDFSLPLRVINAGNYQISFKVIDAQGAEVGQFGLSRALAANSNTAITATVLADKLQRSDGPYRIESVLVVGGGSTAQASRVPVAASAISRWQYFPTITGDLNGDGSVNAADRDLLMQYRGQSPLIPGDRRDLNGDGKIDLQDARLLIQRACTAPNCPRN